MPLFGKEISLTLIIIVITVIISLIAFNNHRLRAALIFYPPAITERNQWYRFFSCGFIHADIPHLMFNMYALYIFGAGSHSGLEYQFTDLFGEKGPLLYLLLYIAALGFCLLPTYAKNRNNYNYSSLGASGAVSAVIFAQIILNPLMGIGMLFIPLFIAGFLFGILYLVISSILDKRGKGNVNHSAHIWGAIFGVIFLIIIAKIYQVPVLENFIDTIKNIQGNELIHFGG